jgi:hypothetical protein
MPQLQAVSGQAATSRLMGRTAQTGLASLTQAAGMQPGAGQQPGAQGQPGGQGGGQPPAGQPQSFLSGAGGRIPPPSVPSAVAPPPSLPGTTSISEMGNYLGRMYGIDIGGSGLFDEEGTALRTPRNADEAAAFNLISQRLADEKMRGYEKKAESALQQQQGLLQKGGRGSLAAYTSGTYGQMAQLYASRQVNPSDFSYWIAKEFQEKQEKLVRDQMRMQKKAAKRRAIGGYIKMGLGIAGAAFTGGASLALTAQGAGESGMF